MSPLRPKNDATSPLTYQPPTDGRKTAMSAAPFPS